MQHIKIPIIVYSPVFIYFWLEQTLQFFYFISFLPCLVQIHSKLSVEAAIQICCVFRDSCSYRTFMFCVAEYLSVWWCQRLVFYRSAAFVSLTVFKCGPALGAVRFDICGPEVNRRQVCDPIVSMGPGLLLSFSVY